MTQNKPLAENEVVMEYLKLLTGARPEAGREYAALLRQMDGVQRQLDAALKELAQVRSALVKIQECPEKGYLSHSVGAAGKGLHAVQQGLLKMKERMVSSAKEAAESMKKSGIKALDKVVSAAGIRKGLEEMHRELAGSAQEVKKSIEKVETVGRELRSVGGHLKNAGRAVLGREQQDVDGGKEGRFQAALLAPLRREKRILDRMNNLVLAAVGSVERLEQEAAKVREGELRDRGETYRPSGAKGEDRGEMPRVVGEKKPDSPGDAVPKPSVLKDIQEKKGETVAHPSSAPGNGLKRQEAVL
jgi:hypothetical protein